MRTQTARSSGQENGVARTDPTNTVTERLRQTLVSLIGCTTEKRDAVYVSAPLTTGKALIFWHRNGGLEETDAGYAKAHHDQVLVGNRERASAVVRTIRKAFGSVVIDPSQLEDVPGWRQADYHAFWCKVVEVYGATVVFVDGWEYSTGCVWEFATAVRTRANLLTEGLDPLPPKQGVQLIMDAIAEMRTEGLATDALDAALAAAKRSVEIAARTGSA